MRVISMYNNEEDVMYTFFYRVKWNVIKEYWNDEYINEVCYGLSKSQVKKALKNSYEKKIVFIDDITLSIENIL